MKSLMIIGLLAILAGCDPYQMPEAPLEKRYGASHIQVWHDDQRGVTCWLYGASNGGISCLPDGVLKQ